MENKGLGGLGVDVKMESEQLENDVWAQNMLKEIGSVMKLPGFTYAGSIATHYYIEDTHLTKQSYSFANKHQITVGDLNERIASTGLTNLAIEVKKYYGHRHGTTNTKDKRGLV